MVVEVEDEVVVLEVEVDWLVDVELDVVVDDVDVVVPPPASPRVKYTTSLDVVSTVVLLIVNPSESNETKSASAFKVGVSSVQNSNTFPV